LISVLGYNLKFTPYRSSRALSFVFKLAIQGDPYFSLTICSLTLFSGELGSSDEEIYGASAHSDYGMVTLLATDGVQGLQARFLN
jgi:hypothetical protein